MDQFEFIPVHPGYINRWGHEQMLLFCLQHIGNFIYPGLVTSPFKRGSQEKKGKFNGILS